MYALIKDGVEVVEYPTYVGVWRSKNTHISLPSDPTEQQLNEVGIFSVQYKPKPDTAVNEVAEVSVSNVQGSWTQVWTVRPATPEEEAMNKAALLAEYDRALTAHFDATAQARRYDNRVTCALRAGYSGPFQAEGQAFAQWMDSCNALAYQWLSEIKSGTKPMFNSTSEFIENLPKIVWPS